MTDPLNAPDIAAPPQPPAFAPPWTAISTRERPPPQTTRTPRTAGPVKLAPPTRSAPRRVRLAPVPVPVPAPATPAPRAAPRRRTPTPTSAQPPTPKSAAAAAASQPSSPSSPSSSLNRSTSQQQRRKSPAPAPASTPPTAAASSEPTDDEKAFLNEQLDKRRRERDAAKAAAVAAPTRAPRTRDQRKRSRSTKARAGKAAAKPDAASGGLKDNFQAYMDEISRDELLGQAQIVTLANTIRDGLLVETAQQELEASLGRRPAVPEVAKKLGVAVAEVQRMRMEGTAAKNTLVAANLRLVTSVARKVSKMKNRAATGLAFDDMVQEGSFGLIRAAEKFDVSRGYKFSTYATWWIRAFVMRSITTQSRSIKVPSTVVDEYSRIRREFERLRVAGNFAPSDEDVARELGMTAAKMRFVMNAVTRVPSSLDSQMHLSADGASTRSLAEMIEGDDHVEARLVMEMERKELDIALRQCLRPLERAVIRLRFGLDDGQTRTLRETGELLGLSKERIRQVIFRALPKLRTPEIQEMLTAVTTH